MIFVRLKCHLKCHLCDGQNSKPTRKKPDLTMAHFSATGWTLSSSVHIRRGSYHPWKAWRMGVVEVSSFALVGITSFPAVEGCEEGWGAKYLCLTRNVSEGQATSRPEFIKCLNFTKISCLF